MALPEGGIAGPGQPGDRCAGIHLDQAGGTLSWVLPFLSFLETREVLKGFTLPLKDVLMGGRSAPRLVHPLVWALVSSSASWAPTDLQRFYPGGLDNKSCIL